MSILQTNLAYVAWQTATIERQLNFMDSVAKRYREQAPKNGHSEESAEVFSGIAQRDAAISLKLSITSTKLAENSQEVAIATLRDSAVMRVITAITIFFLLAIFTATFFSTSFFDFSGGPHDRVYSWWIWLYFLITVVLTVVVVAGTYMLWKKEENEIADR
ncbi:hypothetical protein BDV96DRAFT_601074 [Lophiotrema nucula]|uniref:Uncharacterized protein n=1 Tax=Lophiotrema nucula TaxID=690887 RepID=A0A6A5Z2F6_9PLEO|nr:hypothetical protein BDV96DRAFT_601074 [Lophiotrema nucula]